MDIRTKIMNKHNEVMKMAEKLFCDKISVQDINVKFNFRSTRVAGEFPSKMNKRTFKVEKCIRYNDKFAIIKENETTFINETIPHEIAHYIVHLMRVSVNGNTKSKTWSGHGTMWKKVMGQLGVQPERCHNMTAPVIRSKSGLIKNRFVYKCNCQEHKVSARIHNKIVKGFEYTCSKCKTGIKFVEVLV